MAVSTQASIAAACYAVVILSAAIAAKDKLGVKVMGAAAASVGAFISVCVINCYIVGGCGLLAWVFAGVLVLATAGALMMAYDGKTETLIYRDGGVTHNVTFKETPP
jgi:hypothetical protein